MGPEKPEKVHVFYFLIFLIYFLFIYLAAPDHSMWDLVSPLGIELGPPALGARSPNHWATREVVKMCIFFLNVMYLFYLLFVGCTGSLLPQGLFSSCGEGGLLLVVVHRLLLALASRVEERRHQ